MPCAKGMSACYAGCRHRQMVHEYRAARHAAMIHQEALTGGNATELADIRDRGWRPITFKRWLKGLSRGQG